MKYTFEFDAWWETQDLSRSENPVITGTLLETLKRLAYAGWVASSELIESEVTLKVKNSAGKPCVIRVGVESRGINIRPEGTFTFDGDFAPVYLEMADVPVLYVWPDNESEDFVKIPLGTALESSKVENDSNRTR